KLLLLLLLLNFSAHAQWVELLNGRDLTGWKASENPSSFQVKDGELRIEGPRGHLFYDGPVGNHNFTNFEVKALIKTQEGANSGLFICTAFQDTGWPSQGYEIQVNNSHTDWRRTASLYGIVDTAEKLVHDEEWFELYVKVEGKHITTKINGRTVVDYDEPAGRTDSKRIQPGTIAIQAHDPKSKIAYKSVQVKLN
ncbi:MAG: 3-keto-disaccharide hydrolase, partial [Aquirufa sp.]